MPLKAMFVRTIGLSLLVWVGAEAWAGRVPRPGLQTLSVMAWVAVAGLATLFSVSPRLSFLGEIDQREGLLTVLALAGLHVGAAQAHRNERDVRDTLRVVALSGIGAAVYAQLQLAGLDPIAWSGVHTYTAEGVSALRPAGPLGNPILLGVVLAVALPLVLARLAERTSDAVRWVPAGALLAASLVMTLSRGAWLAAALGAALALGLALRSGARPLRVGWTLAASLSPALLFGAVRAWAPLVARLGEGSSGHSLAVRASIARGAFQLWSERPWLGVGPDAFGLAYPRFQEPALWRDEWIGLPVHAHSAPLQLLATMGLLGVFAGLCWLAAATLELGRAWRDLPSARPVLAALAGAFVALLAGGALNAVGLAGAALFAVCTALTGSLRERPSRAVLPVRPMHPAVPAVAAGLMCVLELFYGTCELGALTLARPSRDAQRPAGVTPGEWRLLAGARAQAMQRAVSEWPFDDALWRLGCQASLAEAEAGVTGDATSEPGAGMAATVLAEHAAWRAVAMEPGRAQNFASLGDALAARALRTGQKSTADSADVAYALASGLAPVDGWLLVARARFQLARRDGVRALEIAQRITGLYPEAAVGHTLTGAALLLLHRPDEARAELLRARAARWEEDAGQQRAAVERLIESVGPGRAAALGAPPAQRRLRSPRR
jgi:O-antigen ligase